MAHVSGGISRNNALSFRWYCIDNWFRRHLWAISSTYRTLLRLSRCYSRTGESITCHSCLLVIRKINDNVDVEMGGGKRKLSDVRVKWQRMAHFLPHCWSVFWCKVTLSSCVCNMWNEKVTRNIIPQIYWQTLKQEKPPWYKFLLQHFFFFKCHPSDLKRRKKDYKNITQFDP